MSVKRTIELPEDLAAFAQMQVDTGHYGSLIEVVREAFGLLHESKKLDALRKELDVGVAQLDSGECTRGTPREMMDGIRARIRLARNQ